MKNTNNSGQFKKEKQTGFKTGIEDYYIIKDNKKMRFGYTTGSCAAAATKASARMLLGHGTEDQVVSVLLHTPKGIDLNLEVLDVSKGGSVTGAGEARSDDSQAWVQCGIMKDGGDDPDVTSGLIVYAKVSKQKSDITIDGGEGVGRVTKPGLEQPVGEAAINSVPRRMIEEALREEAARAGYRGGLRAVISVPGGEKTAEQTFNPRLGIQGGISILGTSGIVEPMSETALIKSLQVELAQQIAGGRKHIVVTLGNYGRDYLEGLENFPLKESVKCSNYVGEVIDAALNYGAEELVFIAHIGKFVKVAGGIMNTHSRNADSRAEILAAAALRAGLDRAGALKILDTLTTDEALDILEEEGCLEETMKIICEKIGFYLNHRSYGRLKTEAMIFSNSRGYLGETAGFRDAVERIRKENE